MKKQIFIAAFVLAGLCTYAQNSNPWPTTGNVGIGTGVPSNKLDVVYTGQPGTANYISAFFGHRGNLGQNTGLFFEQQYYASPSERVFRLRSIDNSVDKSTIAFNARATTNTTRGAISFDYQGIELMRINQNGKVRIGSGANDIATPGDYKLYVEQGILTEKVKVAVKTTGDWADYVFAPEYQLMPLNEVEAFTNENGHLPNIPSADEMVTEGLDVAKMDAKLLEKIEELTLYAIGQNKQIDSLETKLEQQEKELAEMKAQLKQLLKNK